MERSHSWQYTVTLTSAHPKKVDSNSAKAGGLQSQSVKGAAVVYLLQAHSNAGSGVLRLSRRVNKMASNRPNPLAHQRINSRTALRSATCSLPRVIQTFGHFFMQQWGYRYQTDISLSFQTHSYSVISVAPVVLHTFRFSVLP